MAEEPREVSGVRYVPDSSALPPPPAELISVRRVIWDERHESLFVLLGIAKDELEALITGDGANKVRFQGTDFLFVGGSLSDGRFFYLDGHLRDGVLAVRDFDAAKERFYGN